MSEHAFQVITVGTAILGADGMSAEVGATTFDEAEARTAIAMAANAQRVVVAVDGSKIGKVTLAKMVPLSEIRPSGHRLDGDPQTAGTDCGRGRARPRRRGRRRRVTPQGVLSNPESRIASASGSSTAGSYGGGR